MDHTGAVILAAGGSSRLGQPKQFLLYKGRTLIRHAVDAVAACSPVVVVTGRDHDRIREELPAAEIIHNPDWQRGIGTSIRAGVQRAVDIDPGLAALIIMVCDQPFVTPALIASLRAARKKNKSLAAACSYSDSLGVPAIFDHSLFPALLSLADDSGAKQIISKLSSKVTPVPFPEGAIDIDTLADSLTHLSSAD